MSKITPAQLDGQPWTVTEAVDAEITPDHSGSISFAGDTIKLDAPCNSFTSRFMINGDTLTVFPFSSMPKVCSREAMAVEGALRRALEKVNRFEIDGTTLSLFSFDGSKVMVAKR